MCPSLKYTQSQIAFFKTFHLSVIFMLRYLRDKLMYALLSS